LGGKSGYKEKKEHCQLSTGEKKAVIHLKKTMKVDPIDIVGKRGKKRGGEKILRCQTDSCHIPDFIWTNATFSSLSGKKKKKKEKTT